MFCVCVVNLIVCCFWSTSFVSRLEFLIMVSGLIVMFDGLGFFV